MAPMAGITDRPFRALTASFGGGNIVSEMVAVNALERKNAKTCRIADVRDEPYPVVVQLVGGDPALFAEAAKLAADLGAHSLDINMGCPVRKIVNNNSGSALMKDPLLAAKIIETTAAATPLKVSVKFRKGWDHDHVNAVEFARMCEEIYGGLDNEADEYLQKQFHVENNEMVLEKDITFYSMCEHHLMPFYGKAHIAYIPNGKVTGLSKLARTVDVYARRPQIQERLTVQIADALERVLAPKGIMVMLEAEHTCMTMRGIKKPGSKTVTTVTRGEFKENMELQKQFLAMVKD